MVDNKKSAPNTEIATPESRPTAPSTCFAYFSGTTPITPVFPKTMAITTIEMVVAIPNEIHAASNNPRIMASMDRQNSITMTTAGQGTNPTVTAQASTLLRPALLEHTSFLDAAGFTKA
jgi:hypothetical protein